MNFVNLFKAFNAAMSFADAARQLNKPSSAARRAAPQAPSALQGADAASGTQLEARLTNVVVAALKEAFNRDHARLELERTQLDAEQRRAEAALQLELRRQAVDRELARLRLIAATAMVGWIAALVMAAALFAQESTPARVGLAVGWILLLGALGAAFTAQRQVGASGPEGPVSPGAAGAAMWLLIAGLGATAASMLL